MAKAAKNVDHLGEFDQLTGKMPIERSRQIWNTDGENYTDEQLYKIRDWMYMMADIMMRQYARHKATKSAQDGNVQNLDAKGFRTAPEAESAELCPDSFAVKRQQYECTDNTAASSAGQNDAAGANAVRDI